MSIYDMNKHLPKQGRAVPTMKELPPGTPIQVDLKNATAQVCPCGSKYFIPAITVFKVSALISPTGQELIANQQAIICIKCHLALGEKEESSELKEV